MIVIVIRDTIPKFCFQCKNKKSKRSKNKKPSTGEVAAELGG